MGYRDIKSNGDIAMAIHQSEVIWKKTFESLKYTQSWDIWGRKLTFIISPDIVNNVSGFIQIRFNCESIYEENEKVYLRGKIGGELVISWDYNINAWEDNYIDHKKWKVTGSPEEGFKIRVTNTLDLEPIEVYFEVPSKFPPVNDSNIKLRCDYLYE